MQQVLPELLEQVCWKFYPQDYIRTAHAKGLKKWTVVIKHALRNALIPIMTIAGTDLGNILTGSVLVESVFSIPGIGKMLVDSINTRDLPIVQGGVMYIAVICVIMYLVIDILYTVGFTRIRQERSLKINMFKKKDKTYHSYWSISWNIFKKNKVAMACLGIVIILCLVALFAPWIAPYGLGCSGFN